MGTLIVHNDKIEDKAAFSRVCPFSALEVGPDGNLTVSAACRMCKVCVKASKNGEMEYAEDTGTADVDTSLWRGICVYVDHVEGKIHPVTYELIGKARELADKVDQPVYVLFIGYGILEEAQELLHYPVDEVVVYDMPELAEFRAEPYTAVFEAFIRERRPGSVLVGATTIGRQLAPRVAARMQTGLTADCTVLDMEPNGDLSQIRPAFGGNIMANIFTPRHRPQMATVRYKIMTAAVRSEETHGRLVEKKIPTESLASDIEILSVQKKPKVSSIEQAEIIVAVGRGLKRKEDLAIAAKFADSIGAELAGTRPLVEAGWIDARRQIGLSGRTVRPKLIVCLGISGSVQFAAGMSGADTIIAVNTDPEAAIFNIAHIAVVGDLYEVLPRLSERIQNGKAVQ